MGIDNICILGGTGFVGSQLASRLAGSGCNVKILTRRRERRRDLLVLPTASIVQTNVYDPEQLAEMVRGCDAVINLVGILNESGFDGSGFQRAHVELAQTVVQACQKAGVRRLLHMSALNADENGPSHYLRTKGQAETLVHNQDQLDVTSFRPSVIFGPQDSFINRFATLLQMSPLVFPLACPDARFAPVYVGDVVDAFVAALDDHSTHGQRVSLCGPREYTLREIVEYTAKTMGQRRAVIGLWHWASRIQAALLEIVPGKPFSLDNFNSLSVDSVCKGGSSCPTSMESIVPEYLGRRGTQARLNRSRADYWTPV